MVKPMNVGTVSERVEPVPHARPVSVPGLRARNVLIVEDEAIIAMDMEFAVLDAGARCVEVAPDNRTALRLIDEIAPDVVLLDYRLADGDSEPTARRAREAGIPVVFHSGHAQREALEKSYPDAVILPKPSALGLILRTLAEVCAER